MAHADKCICCTSVSPGIQIRVEGESHTTRLSSEVYLSVVKHKFPPIILYVYTHNNNTLNKPISHNYSGLLQHTSNAQKIADVAPPLEEGRQTEALVIHDHIGSVKGTESGPRQCHATHVIEKVTEVKNLY